MENNEKVETQEQTSNEEQTISEKVKATAEKVKDKVVEKTSKGGTRTKQSKVSGEIKVSEKEYTELKEKLEEAQADFLRARADFENYRKRSQEELIQARDRAINSFVVDLLPAVDNFEMSLKMTDNKEMFVKGVEMIHGNLLNTLKEHHFETYEPQIGEDFNVELHEPIAIEAPDKEEGKILAVLQKGVMKKEKTIRPAKVHIKKVE